MDVYWMFLMLCLAPVLALALGVVAVKLLQYGIAATKNFWLSQRLSNKK